MSIFLLKRGDNSISKEFSLHFPFVSPIPIVFNFDDMTVSFRRSGVTTTCSSKEEVTRFYQTYEKENQKMENFMNELKFYIEQAEPTSFVNLTSTHLFLNGKNYLFKLESKTTHVDYKWKIEYYFSMNDLQISVIEEFDEFKEKVLDEIKNIVDEAKENKKDKDVSSLYFRKFLVEVFGSSAIRTGLTEKQVDKEEFINAFKDGYQTDDICVPTKNETELILKPYQHEYMNKVIKVVVFREYVLILFFSGSYPFLEIYKESSL